MGADKSGTGPDREASCRSGGDAQGIAWHANAPSAAALRDREARVSSLFRAAPVGLGLIVGRTMQDVNEAVCKITGYSREELVGSTTRFLYESQEAFEAAGVLYEPKGDPLERTVHVTRWVRKDGRMIDVELCAARVEARDPGRGATVAVTDITEQKRAHDALRASQALLSETQSIARIGSWELDYATGRFTWTDACYRIYGFEPGEVVPTTEWVESRVPPEDLALIREHLTGVLESGEFRPPLEHGIVRRDGAVRWLHVTGVVQRSAANEPVRSMGTMQDVTDLKTSEAQRLELERRLLHAQKLESLGVLAGGIAHDFNNLLLAILGNLELAQLQCAAGSPCRANIDRSAQAARRAAELTRQMLDYSGRSRVVTSRIDLSELVRENAHLLRSAVPRIVSLDLRLAQHLPRISGDTAQVQQVVMNLLTNASEAVGEGPGTVSLETGVMDCDTATLQRSRAVEVPPAGRFVYLDVKDTGCGMDGETLRRLFDPFFTTKTFGRGLGMSSILGIVRAHKGAILIESSVGQGTSVRVLFPCGDTTAASDASEGQVPRASPTEPERGQRGTVLVVDDEEIVRTVCVRMLERQGWSVLAASSGPEALAILGGNRERVSCVLLDLSMPEMDGIATFREMRKLVSDLPVLLSSGFGGEQEAVTSLEGEGLAGFIQKPYSFGVLDAELRRVARDRSERSA